MEYLANGKVTLPGTLPAEKELARLLGVGQSTHREALRILETWGFVEVVSGRATRIRRLPSTSEIRALSGWPTPREQRLSEVLEALEVRSLLEAKAAALAARRGSDAQLAAVTSGLKDMGEAIARGRTEEIKGADTLFHAALASAAGNRLMSGLLRRIDESLEGTHLALLAMPGYVSEMSADHLALAEAVLSRSPETATQAVITHAARLEEDARRCRVA